MKRLTGYIVAIVGLVAIAGGLGLVALNLSFLDGVASKYIIVGGIVLIVVGAVMSMKKKKVQKQEEVPIYEGEKVVGYRRS